MLFQIFKNKIYYSYDEADKNSKNDSIYFSKDYIARNFEKLKNLNKKNFYEKEYNFFKFIYSIILYDKKKNFSLLDFGSGLGNTILEIYKKGYFHKNLKINLFDFNPKLIEISKKFLKKNFKRNSFKNINFISDFKKLTKYDAIHFGSMLEYVYEKERLFESLFLQLKKKPKYLFFSDLYLTTKCEKDFYCVGKYYNQTYIVKFHNLKKLEKLLKYYEYKIIDKRLFMPKIQGVYKFFDMNNLPKKNRIYHTYNIQFEYFRK